MLKGHVFKKQIFGNQIFALFINTFLDGKNGVLSNYKNKMAITYSNNNITIASGCACVCGRFLEEDTSTTIAVGTGSNYCKLVIEIDLGKENTENELVQACYKVIKGSTAYPNLTTNDIIGSGNGIYQFELARFKTSSSGISEFNEIKNYLDYRGIYKTIEDKIKEIEDGSAFFPNDRIKIGKEIPDVNAMANGDIYIQYFD